MNAIKIRKNFLLDKEIMEKVQAVVSQQQKSLTEIINLYFKAIIKEPSILETVEKSANKRTGRFIGMLDNKIGDINYKEMKKEYHENRIN